MQPIVYIKKCVKANINETTSNDFNSHKNKTKFKNNKKLEKKREPFLI